MYDVRSTFSFPVLCFNPRTYMQIHTLTVVQGDETIPRVFDMLQYFEMILRSVESL